MKVLPAVRLGVAMAAIFAAGTAFAQRPDMMIAQGPGPGGPGSGGPGFGNHRPPMERAMRGDRGQWWNNPRIADKLNLTDDQRKAMDAIYQEHREKLVDLRGNVEKAEIRDGAPREGRSAERIGSNGADRQGGPGTRRAGKGQCAVPVRVACQAYAGSMEAGTGVPAKSRRYAGNASRRR